MAVYSSANGMTPFEELMTAYIKRKTSLVSGDTKKAQEIAEAKDLGFRVGIAVGLVALANQERRDLYNQLPSIDERPWLIPMLYEGQVAGWLYKLGDRWDYGEFKKHSDEELFAELEVEFEDIVNDDDFMKHYEQDRKACVLAGLIDPKKDDEGWLREEMEVYMQASAPAQNALAKLGAKE